MNKCLYKQFHPSMYTILYFDKYIEGKNYYYGHLFWNCFEHFHNLVIIFPMLNIFRGRIVNVLLNQCMLPCHLTINVLFINSYLFPTFLLTFTIHPLFTLHSLPYLLELVLFFFSKAKLRNLLFFFFFFFGPYLGFKLRVPIHFLSFLPLTWAKK